MDYINKFTKTGCISAILYLLFGLLLLLWTEISFPIICNILGTVCIILGLAQIIVYFLRDHKKSLFRNDFAYGLITLVIGIVMLSTTNRIVAILPIILGIIILISSAFKLQNALDLKQIKFKAWALILIFAVISIVMGSVMVWNPFETAEVLLVYVGICYALDGIFGLVGNLMFRHQVKGYLEESNSIKENDTMKEAEIVSEAEVVKEMEIVNETEALEENE